MKAFGRIVLATVVALILSSLNLEGSEKVLQSLYTVLGILYSIAMSLVVSFNLSQIRAVDTRRSLRKALKHIRNSLTVDFSLSSVALIISLCINEQEVLIPIYSFIKLDTLIVSTCIVIISMIYEILNFSSIQNLNDEVVEKIMEEEDMK